MSRHLPSTTSLLSLLLLTFSFTSEAQISDNYVASVIEFGESFQDFSVADLNGDQLDDLVVSNWNEDYGRELRIYWQQENGKFPAQASRQIEIKRDIIAYALADIRSEAGEEILFFTASSIFSYSATHDSYASNLQKLADWPFISAVPSRRALHFLGRHSLDKHTLNQKSESEKIRFLVPGSDHYGLLSAKPASEDNDTITLLALPTAERQQNQSDRDNTNIQVNTDNGITLEVGRPSNFENLFVERLAPKTEAEEDKRNRSGENSYLLSLKKWTSNVESAQLIPGSSLEFIYIDEKPKSELNKSAAAAKNNEQSTETQPIDEQHRINIVQLDTDQLKIVYQQSIEKKDEVKLFDFNNDGLMDLLSTRITGFDDVNASIYLNRSGLSSSGTGSAKMFDFDKPDHVVKFTGYDVNFSLSDINGDDTPDLIVGAYQISAISALRDGALVRTSLIYAGNSEFSLNNTNDATLYKRRPDFKLEENFNADDVKGLSEAINFNLDINGDGNKDAVFVNKRGALTAKKMSKQFRLDDESHWEFVPLHYVTGLSPQTLNEDKRPDFVIRHQNAITVLVSQ